MRNLIFKTLYFFGFINFFPLKKGSVKVLCFHRVSNGVSPGYAPLSPSVFERLISSLSKKVDFIDFDDLNARSSNKPAVIITFDDAFQDFETFALPILKKYNAPVTLNVIVSCAETGEPHWTQKINCLIEEFAKKGLYPTINDVVFNTLEEKVNEGSVSLDVFHSLKGDSLEKINKILASWEEELNFDKKGYTPMMKWNTLKNILGENQNINIGNHTLNHQNLKFIVDQDEIEEEVNTAHQLINKKLNCKLNRFAFPNGEYNNTSIKLVVDSGYKYIQLTELSQESPPKNAYYRVEPFFNSFEENLFKIHGFHDFVKRK